MNVARRPEVRFTRRFVKEYARMPANIQHLFEKQLELLFKNPHHPSLHRKKMKGQKIEIWEVRISRNYRFTFHVENDCYILRRIGTHDILHNP